MFTFISLALSGLPALGEDSPPMPAVIDAGFKLWAAKNVSYAFDAWKKGGLLENDSKPVTLSRYFSRMDRTLGNYLSYEPVQTKSVGDSTRIVYLAIRFEHAAMYARFLTYRSANGWLIQNMDFSPKPEAMMPWLTFEGEDYTQ